MKKLFPIVFLFCISCSSVSTVEKNPEVLFYQAEQQYCIIADIALQFMKFPFVTNDIKNKIKSIDDEVYFIIKETRNGLIEPDGATSKITNYISQMQDVIEKMKVLQKQEIEENGAKS